MADLVFEEPGSGCKAKKFFLAHPEICAMFDRPGDGKWYILDHDGKRVQDDWDKPKPKIVGKIKEVKEDG